MRWTIDRDWRGKPVDDRFELALDDRGTELRIALSAPYHADAAPVAPRGRLWELWNYEVFEIFLAGPDERYVELEFGPHGHYLALRLAGERNIVDYELPVASYAATIEGSRWHGEATFDASLLPPAPLRFNAYAMYGEGPRAQLALFPLDGAEADFHQLASFRPLRVTATLGLATKA